MDDTTKTDQDGTLARLCAQYDALLEAPDTPLTAESESELRAMAKIFDLDVDKPIAEVWSQLRDVLVKQVPAQPGADPAPEPRAFEPLTLLLVEDDALAATSLTEALDEAGHRVIGPFHSAEAAEAASAHHSLDAALLDINLSGAKTGVDLARKLKAQWGIPIIFLSGDVTAAARNADLVETMVIKPYTGQDILDALGRILPRG